MNKLTSKSLSSQFSQDSASISKVQKQFAYLIKKIDQQKQQLLEWQEVIPHYRERVSNEFEVLLKTYNKLRAEFIHLLDKANDDNLFKATDKKKIKHLICAVTTEILSLHPDEDIKALHDKYHKVGYDQKNDAINKAHEDLFKSMMKEMLDIELDEDIDFSDPRNFEERMREKIREREVEFESQYRIKEERKAKRKKTPKQLANEEKKQLEEKNISKSIQDVYRKLAAVLHPDREHDEAERDRKTVLMQRVNVAYDKRDLLELLELQLEIEQINPGNITNLAEDRLKYYNKILKQQSDELQQELQDVQLPYKLQLHMPSYQPLTPRKLISMLDSDIADLQDKIQMSQEDLLLLRDKSHLKVWLKNYQISDQSDHFYNELL